MSPDPQDQPERSALLELRERKGSLGIQERWASRGPQAEPLDRRGYPGLMEHKVRKDCRE